MRRLTLETFMREANHATELFDAWAGRLNPFATADHLCYRCQDDGEFERVRSFFERPDGFLYQSWISGRRIAVIKFDPALPTFLGPISFLELSDQKKDGSQKRGFDHIEIYPTCGSVEELVASFARKQVVFEKHERPHHVTYDALISPTFKVRIEPEALIDKIKRDEMH
ncbi:MAG: VOC family protein [Patescibacteria group bacterium]|nr:MAG: VOC family protein [Patescibacteria group bacterium]